MPRLVLLHKPEIHIILVVLRKESQIGGGSLSYYCHVCCLAVNKHRDTCKIRFTESKESTETNRCLMCCGFLTVLPSLLLFLHLEILDDQDHRDSAFLLTFKDEGYWIQSIERPAGLLCDITIISVSCGIVDISTASILRVACY